MTSDKRNMKRVSFEEGFEISVVAIDGTWSIRGRISDVSETGAKFRALSPLSERMRTEEFFVFLTPNQKVRRRAILVWADKGLLGIKFVKAG